MVESIAQLITRLRQMFDSVAIALYETAEATREAMSEPGKPVLYPIDWDSERQKRAYFATGGFGEGIPYQRQELYEHSWSATATEYGARLHAPHPAGAIGGTTSGWQSSVTRNRWPHLLTQIFKELAKLPERISNRISVIGNGTPK